MQHTSPGKIPALVTQFCQGFGGSDLLRANNIVHSEIPSNLVLKKVSPKIWLPFLTVAWGIVTMCLGFVKNYTGFMVVRAILGITEGGLLPGIVSLPFCSELKAMYLISVLGFIFIRDVYASGDGTQDWTFLYCCFAQWCFWR